MTSHKRKPTVKRGFGKLTFVPPDEPQVEACPTCGGELAPAFGEIIEDDGTRRPYLDPTTVRCRDCHEYFKVEQP